MRGEDGVMRRRGGKRTTHQSSLSGLKNIVSGSLVYPRETGDTEEYFLPPLSSGDDFHRTPPSLETLRRPCQPSPFLQQRPLP